MKNLFNKINVLYKDTAQKVGVLYNCPSEKMTQFFYIFLGVALINLGVADLSYATTGQQFTIDDSQFLSIICAITRFIEGGFGALIMIVAGIGAIVSAAFGQYRAAIGLLAVAIGAFVLRSLVSTFFGARILQNCQANIGGGGTIPGGN